MQQSANTASDAGEDVLQVTELNRWRRRRFLVSAATTGSRRRARIRRSATCRRRRRAATIVLLTGQRRGSDGPLWLWCGGLGRRASASTWARLYARWPVQQGTFVKVMKYLDYTQDSVTIIGRKNIRYLT